MLHCVSFPDLSAVLLLESLVFLPAGIDTVDHGLDKFDFRVAQSLFVIGDVEGANWKVVE